MERSCSSGGDVGSSGPFGLGSVVVSALTAMHRPLTVLLPFYATVYALLVTTCE